MIVTYDCQMCILIEGIVLIFLPCTCRVINVGGGLTVVVDHRHQIQAHASQEKKDDRSLSDET